MGSNPTLSASCDRPISYSWVQYGSELPSYSYNIGPIRGILGSMEVHSNLAPSTPRRGIVRGRQMTSHSASRLDSAVAIRNVKSPGRYSASQTLYLMVWPNGRKTWVQRLTIEGKRTDLGLGPYPAVSLAQAREKALDNRSLAKSGGNPLAGEAGGGGALPDSHL